MTQLERCKKLAQDCATRENKKYAVINLNRVGIPLYCVREWHPSWEKEGPGRVVETFEAKE